MSQNSVRCPHCMQEHVIDMYDQLSVLKEEGPVEMQCWSEYCRKKFFIKKEITFVATTEK